ncbi:MAG: deoxyribose-phosphate aldolase [Candidatus Nanopelagicales bacterium]
MAGMTISRADLAHMVDHTLLKPEATPADVAALAAEANSLAVFSICISPSFLPLPAGLLDPSVKLCTVVGFPSGKVQPAIKAAEAALAVEQGADEVDMVVDIGMIKAGEWRHTENEIRAVREAIPGTLLKVILETACLTDDEIVRAAVICREVGADFVKTSTGFHPAGGATAHAISLMAQTVGSDLGVKASGGVRTAAAALEMIAAGATRLGLSGTQAVLDGLDGDPADEAAAGDSSGY